MKKVFSIFLGIGTLLVSTQVFAQEQAIFERAKESKLTTAQTLQDFRSQDMVSRQEMTAFLYRFRDNEVLSQRVITTKLIPFLDAKNIAPEFGEMVQWVANARIMKGNNQHFLPVDSISRYEALLAIMRTFDEDFNDEQLSYRLAQFDIEATPDFLRASATRVEVLSWIMQLHDRYLQAKTPLEGEWILEALMTKDHKTIPFKDIMLKVRGDRISIRFCNAMSGTFSLQDGKIKTNGFASTKMLCGDDELMQAELAFDMRNATISFSKGNKELEIATTEGNKYRFMKKSSQ